MRKFVMAVVVAGLAVALGARGQEGDLLAALDRARFLDAPASQLTIVVRSKSDGKVEEAELRLAFKDIAGKSYARIEFLRPADQAGQVFLVTPQGTFFWQPELFSPIQLSGAQVGFGDVPVGQLAGIRFANDYRVEEQREEVGEGGAVVLALKLRANSPTVPFQTVIVLVDPSSGRPRELRLLAVTGVLLYRIHLTAYAELDGDLYVRDQVVENALLEGTQTALSIVGIEFEPLPDEAFDPALLGEG